MTTNIKAIKAREVLDSRGNPTIEAEVFLENGICGSAMVPSGASTGKKEALELRDQDLKRYRGNGVLKAVSNILHKIQPALLNKAADQQLFIDQLLIELDGTDNKSILGANAILAVSLAVARASACYYKLELYEYLQNIFICKNYNPKPDPELKLLFTKLIIPSPLINIINGGVHADNNLSVQEFMIMPLASSFKESIRFAAEVFYSLKSILKQNKLITAIGDEGGFAPNIESQEKAMDYILLAIEQAGLIINKDLFLALDVAASELFNGNRYIMQKEELSSEQLVNKLTGWVNNYPIISIEDGMAEDDVIGWQILTKNLGHTIQLIGDDLFVTNPKIFKKFLDSNIPVANAILIKPNQIGTLSETFSAINLAKKYNYQYIISHRSGETEDPFIADLAVATGSWQIKTGSICRSSRVAKYNRLLKIEEILNPLQSSFMGGKIYG